MCPFACSNGHDATGLIDKTVPGEAAMVEDVVVGSEDAVREPVVAQARRLATQRRTRYIMEMLRSFAAALVMLPTAGIAADQAFAPGSWDVTSTTVDMSVPGLPGFIARMMRGKSKTEHKRLSTGQGIEALIAPDPKARCHVEVQRVVDGKYNQALTCPRKRGEPVHVSRAGSYDRTGFVGQATITGMTSKGPMRIVLNQRAARVGN